MDIEYDREFEERCEYEQENLNCRAYQDTDNEEYWDRIERARDMQQEFNKSNVWK